MGPVSLPVAPRSVRRAPGAVRLVAMARPARARGVVAVPRRHRSVRDGPRPVAAAVPARAVVAAVKIGDPRGLRSGATTETEVSGDPKVMQGAIVMVGAKTEISPAPPHGGVSLGVAQETWSTTTRRRWRAVRSAETARDRQGPRNPNPSGAPDRRAPGHLPPISSGWLRRRCVVVAARSSRESGAASQLDPMQSRSRLRHCESWSGTREQRH